MQPVKNNSAITEGPRDAGGSKEANPAMAPIMVLGGLAPPSQAVAGNVKGRWSTMDHGDHLKHSNSLFPCLFFWYDVITCKSKQIIRRALSGAFSKIS